MKKTIYIFSFIVSGLLINSCTDDDQSPELNPEIVGIYEVTSIKSNTNLYANNDYLPSSTELIPLITCNINTLEINLDYSFIWNAKIYYQDYVTNNDNVITSASEIKCDAFTLNGTVIGVTDSKIILSFDYENSQETVVVSFVNSKWEYITSNTIFFQGHAALVDGVITHFPNAKLSLKFDKF